MNIRSIRVQLPVSYAVMALLTTLVLGIVLLLTLQGFYSTQERNYLSTNAALMSPGIANVLADEQNAASLNVYVQNLSYIIQARIRVLDPEGYLLADSGELQSQQFVFTNLTPQGMNAEVLREGRADSYLFQALINVIDQPIEEDVFGDNPVFLAQVPLQPAIFGAEPGTQGVKELQHSDQKVSTPILDPVGEVLGTLEVSEGYSFGGNIIQTVARAWMVAGSMAVLIPALIGWVVSSRFTAPVTELIAVTEYMASGKLSSRSEIRTRNEFYTLGQSFNLMAEKLENTIETLRNFITDAAHELLTPVSALRVNLELAREDSNPRKLLREAEVQALRLQAIVESLLDLSKIESGHTQLESISLKGILADLENTWAPLAAQKNLQLQITYPEEDINIHGNQAQITKALGNLLDNAIKFSNGGGHICIGVKEAPETIQIYVRDEGIGISENEHTKVFQRFFRGRNTSEIPGSGLGLAIVKAVVERHNGTVTLESSQDGTTVSLDLWKA
jgi:signal transduction histidine kinase